MIQILTTNSRVVATLRVASAQDDIAFVSGWKKRSIVSLWVISVVNDDEPRMTRIGKPCFHLLKIASVGSTRFRNLHEGLPCCCFVGSVDPENTPVTVSKMSAADSNASVYDGL